MARARTNLGRAAALHRRAAAVVEAAEQAVATLSAAPPGGWYATELRDLADRMRSAAATLAPGWLSVPLDSGRIPPDTVAIPALAGTAATGTPGGRPALPRAPGVPEPRPRPLDPPGPAGARDTDPAGVRDTEPAGVRDTEPAGVRDTEPAGMRETAGAPQPAGGPQPTTAFQPTTPFEPAGIARAACTAQPGSAGQAIPAGQPATTGQAIPAGQPATTGQAIPAGQPTVSGGPARTGEPAGEDRQAVFEPERRRLRPPVQVHRAPPPVFVRVGQARPVPDSGFPVLVPLLGHGNLTVGPDARDTRVAGLLRSIALRLLAAVPAGMLRVVALDAFGGTFGTLAPVETVSPDRDGLRALLAEGEQWLRSPGPGSLLLVVASLPDTTEAADLSRLVSLAQTGPPARLHVAVAGWPPPGRTGAPLPLSTHIAVYDDHALVGTPAGTGALPGTAPAGGTGPTGFDLPFQLDADPHPDLLRTVGGQIAARMASDALPELYELLPEHMWREAAAGGLQTPVGRASNGLLVLRFNDLTPHWMVGGRSGAGKTAFLINVLYGLATRYGPDQMTLYLLDFKEGVSFTEFTPTDRDPTWIPQARAVGIESDREYGVAVLRELDAEMVRRAEAFKAAGVTRFADLPDGRRVVCVIDEFQVLLEGNDALAREAVTLLESLARRGRSSGIHLVLASQTVRGVEALYAKRDSIFGQFPVRIALPGGGDVLDPLNQSAATLGLGEAVVNTAGGLGGPAGASRAHERIIRFPDPHANPAGLAAVRHRLWQSRPAGNRRPYVFAGFAPAHLEDDADYAALRAGHGPAGTVTALLGRRIDVPLSTAALPLDATPGRHLAILGPGAVGGDVLHAAARSLARQVEPGSALFAVWAFSPAARGPADELALALAADGHRVNRDDGGPVPDHTFVLAFGADGSGGALRPLLRDGPARGVHLLGWWRGLRRFTEDTGGSAAREDVAGLLFLNVPGQEVAVLLGDASLDWRPRANRALLHDRHTGRSDTIVPFSRIRRPE